MPIDSQAKSNEAGPDRLLDIPEVRRLFGGISRATLYRMIERGELPEPLKLGPRMSRFRQSDIDDAMKRLPSGRRR